MTRKRQSQKSGDSNPVRGKRKSSGPKVGTTESICRVGGRQLGQQVETGVVGNDVRSVSTGQIH